ncbi:hypothetical protein TI04_11095, partial [Achromatium sp. WMS2]
MLNEAKRFGSTLTWKTVIAHAKATYMDLLSYNPYGPASSTPSSIQELKAEIKKLEKQLKNQPSSSTTDTTSNSNDKLCAYCQKPGHRIGQCSKLRTDCDEGKVNIPDKTNRTSQNWHYWKRSPPSNGDSETFSIGNKTYKWCNKCNYWNFGRLCHSTEEHKEKSQVCLTSSSCTVEVNHANAPSTTTEETPVPQTLTMDAEWWICTAESQVQDINVSDSYDLDLIDLNLATTSSSTPVSESNLALPEVASVPDLAPDDLDQFVDCLSFSDNDIELIPADLHFQPEFFNPFSCFLGFYFITAGLLPALFSVTFLTLLTTIKLQLPPAPDPVFFQHFWSQVLHFYKTTCIAGSNAAAHFLILTNNIIPFKIKDYFSSFYLFQVKFQREVKSEREDAPSPLPWERVPPDKLYLLQNLVLIIFTFSGWL